MASIYPMVKIKIGCVCLVAMVKQTSQGKCIELGYAIFCGNSLAGLFADLADALKCFEAEVKRVYPNPADHLNIVFVEESGKKHYCESRAEATRRLLEELTLLRLSDLPGLKASEHEIKKAYLDSTSGSSIDLPRPEDSDPQP